MTEPSRDGGAPGTGPEDSRKSSAAEPTRDLGFGSVVSEGQRTRRAFAELKPRRGLRDSDAGSTSVRIFALIGAGAGLILGGALGFFLRVKGMAPGWVAALCPFLGAAAVSFTTVWLTESAGRAAATLYAPSGRSTPPKREYSQAEAMVAQGRYEEGITAFELAVAEDGRDPTPYLRVARVYRDHLGRHEDAARWFRRALREAVVPGGVAMLVRKELVELYTHGLGQPERALPELARMADELAGTEAGTWAAGRLAEIKSRMSSPPPEGEGDPGTTS